MTAIPSTNIASIQSHTPSLPHAPTLLSESSQESSPCIFTGDPGIDAKLSEISDKIYYIKQKRISYQDGNVHIQITTPWTPRGQFEHLSHFIENDLGLTAHIDWQIVYTDKDEANICGGRKRPKTSQQKLTRVIEDTAPKGTQVHKVTIGPKRLGNRLSSYPFAIAHITSCGVSDEELTRWQESLVQDHNACTHLVHTHVSQSPFAQLHQYADSDGVLRTWKNVPTFDILINSRRQPTLNQKHFDAKPGGRIVDLRHVEFLSTDDTERDDPEDMVFARYLPNGDIELIVGIAYAAPALRTSKSDIDYLMRCGNTIYGTKETLHNSGEIYKAIVLTPDRDRYILATRTILSPTQGIVHSESFQAIAANRIQLHAQDFNRAGAYQKMTTPVLDAARILRALRTGHPLKHAHDLPGVDTMVMETCIHAYGSQAADLQKARVPFYYRIHSPPTKPRINSLKAKLRSLGYPRSMLKLGYPDNLLNVMKQLDRDGHSHIKRELADTMQTRGRFSLKCWSHFDLKAKIHTALKFRTVVGTFNQFQIEALESGRGLLSIEQLQKYQGYMNRQNTKSRRKTHRLKTLEQARDQIANRDEPRSARLTGERAGEYPLLDVPDISNKAVLIDPPAKHSDNSQITVKLEGIDTKSPEGLFLYRQAS